MSNLCVSFVSQDPLIKPAFPRILGVVPCRRMENDCTCFGFGVIALAYLLKLKRIVRDLNCEALFCFFLQNNRLRKAERSKWVTLSSRSEL